MKRVLSLIFSLLFISTGVYAKTIVVSDLDDTLKLSAVRDVSLVMDYAIDEESGFVGMSELFNLIKKTDEQVEFFYVSNAPLWAMEDTHKNFLSGHHYPQGLYVGSDSFAGDDHKFQSISQIINETHPDRVIFFGDNGEIDAQTYHSVAAQFKNIRFSTFIRTVYNSEDGLGQLSSDEQNFVTPVEVAYSLVADGVLKLQGAQSLNQKLLPYIQNEDYIADEGIVSFADWQDCSEFIWPVKLNAYRELAPLRKAIDKVCHE